MGRKSVLRSGQSRRGRVEGQGVRGIGGRAPARARRRTGKKLWEADTIVDRKLPYSSTGAPQIAGSVVVIGNSGADMGHGAVRGYISAYDLETGALKWRFFTVPPAVGQPYENPELAAGRQDLGSAPQA